MTLYAMVRGETELHLVLSHYPVWHPPRIAVALYGRRFCAPTDALRIGELHHWQAAAANEPDVARAMEAIR